MESSTLIPPPHIYTTNLPAVAIPSNLTFFMSYPASQCLLSFCEVCISDRKDDMGKFGELWCAPERLRATAQPYNSIILNDFFIPPLAGRKAL